MVFLSTVLACHREIIYNPINKRVNPMAKQRYELVVNGKTFEVYVELSKMLLEVLREELGATNTGRISAVVRPSGQ